MSEKAWTDWLASRLWSDPVAGFLREVRDRAVHRAHRYKPQSPAQTHRQTNIGFTGYLTITDSLSATLNYADGTVGPTVTSPTVEPPPPRETEVTQEEVWVFDERPDTDVITLCEEFVAQLEQLVAECEARFPSQP